MAASVTVSVDGQELEVAPGSTLREACREAAVEISAIKVLVPNVVERVFDRAIQIFGGAGVSDDFPLAYGWAYNRTLRLVDGPDEVHKAAIARRELKRYRAD